jgi:hydrophobe/amphiphile efflux-1 (HAE1) family protein
MFSRFFINRPIFATVTAILLVLAGLITINSIPIAQYPNISPPTVQVSASYPGADAKTVAESIGIPIEESVNSVEGMLYMSSTSNSDGSYNLRITFENGVDLDEATVKVQNLVSEASAQLPDAVTRQGIDVSSKSTDILLFVALESDNPQRYDALYLTNYAQLHLVDELARIDGVGGVSAFGAGEYSMRIWLDPNVMKIRNITPDDVISAIEAQNIEVSAGAVGAEPNSTPTDFQFSLTANGRLVTPEQFGQIILRSDDSGNILRLNEIAKIELGSETYGSMSRVSGHEAGLIGIYQRSDANALKVAKAVESKLDEIKPLLPDGVSCRILMNTTNFVSASISEVLTTFAETTLIVMFVIMIFLQNLRAIVIPMLTIPVSLIATLAVMKLLGFTFNTLTLFGLVLAIAIVVDDAIVVVEDCVRRINQEGLSPRDAALKAMQTLQGPIIGEVLVLMSVFIPTAFISGITGELYKQFALTIAVSTAFSGFNALTFTPAMCSLFLKGHPTTAIAPFALFNMVWTRLTHIYSRVISRLLKKPAIAIPVYIALCLAAVWAYSKWPTDYIPEEDMGYFITSVQLPADASLQRTDKVVSRVAEIISRMPEVDDVIEMSGFSFLAGGSGSNLGSMFTILKPWDERKGANHSVDAIMNRLSHCCDSIQEGVIFSINPPAIPGLGMTSGLELQLLDVNSLGYDELSSALAAIKLAGESNRDIASISTLFQGNVPQYHISINRDQAQLMGLNPSDIYSALSSFVGGSYVNDFVDFNQLYKVNVAAEGASRNVIENILKLNVRNSNGEMVPFSAFAHISPIMGTTSIHRYNMYESASLTATAAKNVGASSAIKTVENIVEKATANNFEYAWTGEAYQETQSGTTVTTVLIFAVIMTLLVLAAQYESWSSPIAIIMAMPTALLGTLLGCYLMRQNISIYTQIGIILLLGLAAKNAILIVEYARDYRQNGKTIIAAAAQAGTVRFRPIMMTAIAFVLGVMPMLFATGAGANSRISLGAAVVFGMAINALFLVAFVPNFWVLCQQIQEKLSARHKH